VALCEVGACNNPPGVLVVRLDQMVFADYAGMDFPRATLAQRQPSAGVSRRAWNMLPGQPAGAGRRGPR
jgi:hypothetical protein